MTPAADLLLQRATWAHPHNRTHRQRWVRAAQYLRRRGIWIIDARIARKGEAA